MSSIPIRNLVFEGGGVKGIAYAGALEILEKKGMLEKIDRIAGTSAGAINACLMALGYTNEEIMNILAKTDFNKFQDNSCGVVRDTMRFIKYFGWNKGRYFRTWIGNLIKDKYGDRNLTFGELKEAGGKDLYIVVCNLSTNFTEVMSYESNPNLPIRDAVRASMSIPFFYVPIKIENQYYIDGGILKNYPIRVFDNPKYSNNFEFIPEGEGQESKFINNETLGFRLDSKHEIGLFKGSTVPTKHKIKNVLEFSKQCISTLMNSQNDRHLSGEDWDRTVYIDSLGIKATEFDLSEKKIKALIESGENGAFNYLQKREDVSIMI